MMINQLIQLGCQIPSMIVGLAIGCTVEVIRDGVVITDLSNSKPEDLMLRIRLGGRAAGRLTMDIPLHEKWSVRFIAPRNLRPHFGEIPEWGIEIKELNRVGVARPDWGALIAYKGEEERG